MPTTADIQQAGLRQALEAAERSIDAGDYTAAAQGCAETYLELLRQRPDLAPAPAPATGSGASFNADAFAAGRAARRASWPPGGIRVLIDEAGAPSLAFDKQRFSMSEAITYFEFTVEQVVRAEAT